MEEESAYDARTDFRQGRTATTLLTQDGCYYPVVHEPYSHRVHDRRRRFLFDPVIPRRGDRPMHQTTLIIAKPPWVPDYATTNKLNFSGSQNLEPVRRPPLCHSMQLSQIKLGTNEEHGHFCSDHMDTYRWKDTIPARQLHLASIVNRLNQTEGAEVKRVVKPDRLQCPWSQYDRVHNKLGILRGPGVAREHPVRHQYNILTGEDKGPAWKPNNPRVSGNSVLHNMRRQLTNKPLLF